MEEYSCFNGGQFVFLMGESSFLSGGEGGAAPHGWGIGFGGRGGLKRIVR